MALRQFCRVGRVAGTTTKPAAKVVLAVCFSMGIVPSGTVSKSLLFDGHVWWSGTFPFATPEQEPERRTGADSEKSPYPEKI